MATINTLPPNPALFYDPNRTRGISKIERTTGDGSPGTQDTYTITFTDATTSTFVVTNGRDGLENGAELAALAADILAQAEEAEAVATAQAVISSTKAGEAAASADAAALSAAEAAEINPANYLPLVGGAMSGHIVAVAGASGEQVPRAQEVLLKTGGTMTGHIAAIAGASGSQVPRRSEVVGVSGNETIAGIKTFTSSPVVPAGAEGEEVPQAQEVALLATTQLAGNRNKIINGKMEIARRGMSFPATSNIYTLDRWADGSITTSSVTYSSESDTPPSGEFQASLRVTVNTADTSIAAGEFRFVSQIIEGYNVRDIVGKTCTLSFWVRSSKVGIHCVSLKNSGSDRTYVAEYTINATDTWEKKSVIVPGGLITAGTWNWTNGKGLLVGWALAAGTTFQTTPDAWQAGNYVATANQVNCLDTIGNIFAITGVQLEVGEVATPFEHRSIGAELDFCERYFEVITGSDLPASVFNAGNISSGVRFRTPKRAAPTLAVAAHGQWVGNGTTGTITTTVFGPAGAYGFYMVATGFTGTAVQGHCLVFRDTNYTANAEL